MRYPLSFLIGILILVATTCAAGDDLRQRRRDNDRNKDDDRERDRAPQAEQNREADRQRDRDRDDANRALEEARERLRSAERRAERARDQRDQALRDRDRIGQELTSVNQDEGELTRLIVTHETDARDAKASHDALKSEATEKSGRVDAAKRKLLEAERTIASAKRDAETEFLQSDAARRHQAEIDEAGKAYDAERTRVLESLANDPAYASLTQSARVAEAAVSAARDAAAPNSDVLSNASEVWIAAKSKLGTFERAALERDPACEAAASRLASAKQAQRDALAAFRGSIDQSPRVVAEAQRRDAIAAEHAEAQREVEAVSVRIRAAEADLSQRVTRYNEVSTRLNTARTARDRLASQLVAAEGSARAAEAEIKDAERDIARARQSIADAKRRCDEVQGS